MKGDIGGLIPILVGIYMILLGSGVLPRNSREPEKVAQWQKKFGPFLLICGPIVILIGVLEVFGWL